MKPSKVYLVTWATHNSRASEKLFKYKVKMGEAVWLDEEAESRITMYIRNAVRKYGIRCLAYNICGDHVHMLLICKRDELSSIVRTLKSISAREYNIATGVTKVRRNMFPHEGTNSLTDKKRGVTQNRLWGKKYSSTLIANKKQFQQMRFYIKENRKNHGLPPLDDETKNLIRNMLTKTSPIF